MSAYKLSIEVKFSRVAQAKAHSQADEDGCAQGNQSVQGTPQHRLCVSLLEPD